MSKIKIGGGESPAKVAKTLEEVNAANQEAKRLIRAKGLITGDEAYAVKKVGDALPRYIDSRTGTDYVPAPTKPKAISLPPSIGLADIKEQNGVYWYDDPATGDPIDVDPLVLNLKRFKKDKDLINADLLKRSMAKTK